MVRRCERQFRSVAGGSIRKWRKEVAEDLTLIYTAATAEEAKLQLGAFVKKWDEQLPTISRSWRVNGCGAEN